MTRVIVILNLIILLNSVSISVPQILPLIDYLQTWFQEHETPPYTKVRSITTANVEERIYSSQKWICTQEFSTSKKIDNLRPDMFFRLFMYTDGRNEISKKIQMTLPISMAVEHRNGDFNLYQMCVYLPTDVQENPPKPIDLKVQILTRQELRVYVRRFSGYAAESSFTNEQQILSNTLKNEGMPYIEQDLNSRAKHYNNIYNAPGIFWNRRNEVWLLVPTSS